MPKEDTQFKPGQSGNPGGRAKVVKHVQDLARKHTMKAVNTLVSIMGDKKQPGAARVAAANAVLDRGYGKPVQEHRQLTDGEIADFSADQLAQELLRRRSGNGVSEEASGEKEPQRVH